jgi:hypothetical protein
MQAAPAIGILFARLSRKLPARTLVNLLLLYRSGDIQLRRVERLDPVLQGKPGLPGTPFGLASLA